jgi:spore germination cell wall hydrolase CwlJ-like protein
MVKTFNLFLKIGLVVLTLYLVTKFTTNRIDYYNTNHYNGTPITMLEREKQLTCLAKNIYHEAATEPFEGKVAVAQVTLNRAASGKFPSDICDVVYQKNVFYGKVVCQFSWYCESGPKVKSGVHYKESMEVAKKVLLENFRLPSLYKAMYYHADYVNPNWNLPKINQIGRHIFYGEKNGKI